MSKQASDARLRAEKRAMKHCTHWIGGKPWDGGSERHCEVYYPATGQVTGQVDFASAAEVDLAVAAAKDAFKTWRRASLARRASILLACTVALGAGGMALCGCASPAHSSPAPHAASSGSLPLGVFPGPSPGSYVVDCFAAQCTTQPGAGPFGTTCRTPNTSTDEQYCPASWPAPIPPAAPSSVPTPSS